MTAAPIPLQGILLAPLTPCCPISINRMQTTSPYGTQRPDLPSRGCREVTPSRTLFLRRPSRHLPHGDTADLHACPANGSTVPRIRRRLPRWAGPPREIGACMGAEWAGSGSCWTDISVPRSNSGWNVNADRSFTALDFASSDMRVSSTRLA
ncbi:hypothetical protein FKP32DRAFT_1173141 [Trametes sanguinea]|nr:hypothetical protein FKP32DRAFT_1173141 [Trametes sanguinea]